METLNLGWPWSGQGMVRSWAVVATGWAGMAMCWARHGLEGWDGHQLAIGFARHQLCWPFAGLAMG
jgi:hypothetical protein